MLKGSNDLLSDESVTKMCWPDLFEITPLYGQQELKDSTNQTKLFDEIERLLLKHNPFRFCYPDETSFLFLVPVFSKIDEVLSEILNELKKSAETNTTLKPEVSETYRTIFIRANNIFRRAIVDSTPKGIDVSKTGEIPNSYLNHLIEFLQYCQDPVYTLLVISTTTKYLRKIVKNSKGLTRKLECVRNLLHFGKPFTQLLAEYDRLPTRLLNEITTLLGSECKLLQWESYLEHLLHYTTSEEVEKLIEFSQKSRVNTRVSGLTEKKEAFRFHVAGEVAFLNFVNEKSRILNYEITAVAISLAFISGMLIFHNERNAEDELTRTYKLANNFNFEDCFGLSLAAAYPLELRAASKHGGQDAEMVSMRVLSIDLLLFYISRCQSITSKVDDIRETFKHHSDKHKKQFLKEALNLLEDTTLENTNFREMYTYQILEALDGLIFSDEGKLTGKTLALLDGYKFQSPQAAGAECLESIVYFYKLLVKALKKDKRKNLFKSIEEIVKKRLRSLKVDSYSATLLPAYSMALLYFGAWLEAEEEISALSGHIEERLIEATKELAQGNQIEVLLTGSIASNLREMQLRSFIFGHLPMSFTGYPDSLEEGPADIDRVRTLLDAKSLIQLFGVPAEGEKKALQSILFFTLVADYFDLDSFKADNPSEETCKALVELISQYYNPSAPVFRFVRALNEFLKDSEDSMLRKCLLKSSFVNNTLRENLWFNDEILRWDTVAEYSEELISYYSEALIETLEEMEQFSEESKTEEEAEKVTKAQNHQAKESFMQVLQRFKILISKTNDLIVEVIQSKRDPLTLAIREKFITFHIYELKRYLTSIAKYLKSEDKIEILREIQSIQWIDQGFLTPDDVDSLLSGASGIITSKQNNSVEARAIQSYISIMEILSQFSPTAFDLFGSQEQARQLSRSEIELFGRISYLTRNWHKLEVLDEPNLEDQKGKEKKLSSSAIQFIYLIMISNVSNTDSLDENTESVPTLNLFGPRDSTHIDSSLMNFILTGVFYASKYLESNSIDVLLDSLAKLLETETQVLKALKEGQLESKPPRKIYNQIDALLRVISLIATNLGNLFPDISKIWSKEGYIKIAFHKELLERFLHYVEAAEECDNLFASKLEPTLIGQFSKQRRQIKWSVLKFATQMSSKVLIESPRDSFKVYEERGYSQEEQLKMVDRVSQLKYRVFSLISMSHFTIFAQEGQLRAVSLDISEILSLLYNQIIHEVFEEGKDALDIPPTQEVAEEGEFTVTDTIQTITGEEPSLTNKVDAKVGDQDLTIFELKRKETVHNTVMKNYPKIFQQFILLEGIPENNRLDISIKDLFEQLASNEEFQKFINNLLQEAQLIFQTFANEPVEKLVDLTVTYLPLLRTYGGSGVNAFFSALLFKKFYKALIREIPSEKCTFLGDQQFDFGASSQDIYEKLLQLGEKSISKLLKARLFPELINAFQTQSSESRAREHSKLYEIPFSEFTEHENAILESIYKGALVTLTKSQFYPERAVSLDCVNLLLLTIWNSAYLERIQKDNVVDLLLKLEGEAKTNVIPFILDSLVGDVIPSQHRIEIALKACFLKPIKTTVLEEKNSLYYLQVLNQSDPKAFKQHVEKLLTAVEFTPHESNEKGKKNKSKKKRLAWQYSYQLKDGVDSLKLSQTQEEIPNYLKNSVSKTAIEIINKLVTHIVSDNESAWIKLSESESYENLTVQIDQNLYLLSALLSKYPELRIHVSEAKVQTKIYDQKTLHFTELSEPQEMAFLDYLIHVISPLSYPQNAGAIRCFYGDFTPAFNLQVEGEVMTSHEYFRGLIISKSIAALSILSEKKRVPDYRSLLNVYSKLIRDALDSEFSQSVGNAFFCKILGDLEKIICKFVSNGKSLTDLKDVYRLYVTQLWQQTGSAFCKMDARFPLDSCPLEDNAPLCVRALLYQDRDYSKLESYAPLKDGDTGRIPKKLYEEEKVMEKEVVQAGTLEPKLRKFDDNTKALIVRAIIEGKELTNDFVINFGRDYYSVSKTSSKDRDVDMKKSSHRKFSLLQYAFLQNKTLSEGYRDDQCAVLSKIKALNIFYDTYQPGFNRTIEVEEWAPNDWEELMAEANNLEDGGKDYFELIKANKKEQRQLEEKLKEKKPKKLEKMAREDISPKDSSDSSYTDSDSGSNGDAKNDDSFEIIPKSKKAGNVELFRGLERSKFKKTLKTIQQNLSRIIEKKLLTGFIENLSEFGRVQSPSFNKPDPELNAYINSLKNSEKRIALLALAPEYVGMLSKTLQQVLKRIQTYMKLKKNKRFWEGDSSGSEDEGSEEGSESERNRSHSSDEESASDSGSSRGNSGSGEESDEKGSGSANEKEDKSEKGSSKDEEEKGSNEGDEEEDDTIGRTTIRATSENFEGFRKNSKFPGNRYEDLEQFLSEFTKKDVEYEIKKLGDNFAEELAVVYIANRKNNETMRKALFVASADFIDHFLANLITNSNYASFRQFVLESDSSGADDQEINAKYPILKVLDVFMLLCCNPLNEIRLFDTILTLLSFDCENEAALAAFNEYFGVKLTPIQLQRNRSKFVEVILFIFLRLYAAIPTQTNGFETNNFDRLVVETEVIIGPSPLKKHLLPHCPLLETSPKNFLTEFAISVARSGVSAQIATKTANFALTIRNLRTIMSIQDEPEGVARKISDLIEILVVLNPDQPENLGATTAIADLLEGEEAFFNFLDLVYKNSGSLFKLIEMRLQKTVAALKGLTQESPSAWNQLENQIERLSQDPLFKSLRLTLRLIANQSQNFLDDLNQLKGRLKKSDYNLVLRLKDALSKFHVKQRFGNAYLLLVQTFELLETIKNSSPSIQNNLKALKAPLDIALDAYRIFKIQGKMTEKFEEQQYFLKNTANLEATQSMKPDFARIATKSDEDYDDGELMIPGFERSFSSIKQSGAINIDELFLRLSQKAKNIIQAVVLEGLGLKKSKKKDYYSSSDEENNQAPKFDVTKIKDMALLNKFPWMLKYEAKMDYLYSKLREDRKKEDAEYSGDSDQSNISIDIRVRRDYIVKDSLDYFEKILLVQKNLKLSTVKFRVNFLKEEGIDQGGLENEWLNLVVKDLFDPAHGLFTVAENGVTIQPSPQSHVVSNYLAYFRLAGYIVGYSITRKKPIVVSFTRPFLKQILGKEISIEDLSDVDEKLSQSLTWILNNTLEEGVLDQDFTYEFESFGSRHKVSLAEPGEKFGLVTEENKRLYVKRLIYWKLVKEIEPQVNAFKEGFYKFVKLEHLSYFSSNELDKLIAGNPVISFEELQETTKYSSYSSSSDIIKWFWQIVSGFDQESLSALLFFATGMNRVGPGGFKAKPLTIAAGGDEGSLPTAHTCSATIDLPHYPTKEILAEKLLLAIFEGREGFGFG